MVVYKLKSRFWKFCRFGGVSIVGGLAFANIALAQNRIIPDGTLGAEQSIVTPSGTTDEITGGATRLQNLFHSFREFSIGQGNSAYFNTGNNTIANIFARVTGANQSEIQGILGTRGVSNANLFLINPNGILFGPEGSLDVGGSFIGTTANAIQFSDQSVFSASDPNRSSLVTVQPSALLFNTINSGAIENQSIADAKDDLTGLRVPDGQNLLLVGGDVLLNGGDLHALNGRVDLGGIESTGIVGLNVDGGQFQLDFPENTVLSNVTLDNQSKVNVTAAGNGRISITANQVKLNDASELTAGIGNNQGSTAQPSIGTAIRITTDVLEVKEGTEIHTDILRGGSGNSGDIEINARERILLDGQIDVGEEKDRSSKITSRIEPFSKGKGGNIRVNTGSLTIEDGAFISTSTDADGGTPGGISITARENVSLIGVGADVPSTISSQVLNDARGDAGPIDLTVTEGSLSILQGASINTSTRDQGDAGDIKIDVRDDIRLDGAGKQVRDVNGNLFKSSGIFSTIEENGQGSSSVINISSETLEVTNGAQISALTEGINTDVGNIEINARGKIVLDGQSTIKNSDGKFIPSGIFSNLLDGGSSQGGLIKITSEEDSLTVQNGARINASTNSTGNAQDIFIDVKRDAIFTGKGNGLETDETTDYSGIYSQALPNSTGNAGNIRIDARSIELKDGARILNSTLSRNSGDAGDVEIFPQESLLLESKGFSSRSRQSRIESNVQRNTKGSAGNINIGRKEQKVNFLTLRDGGFISTSTANTANTAGIGDAGDINIFANSLLFEGDSRRSGITSRVNVNGENEKVFGNGGVISIEASSLMLKGGAFITTSTLANGDAGDINILVRDGITLESEQPNGSEISSRVEMNANGDGGSINIETGSLEIKSGALISTNSFNFGNAGNIDITADKSVLIEGANTDVNRGSKIESELAGPGTAIRKAGDINLNANSLTLRDEGFISTKSRTTGNAGDLNLKISDLISLDNGSLESDIENQIIDVVKVGKGTGGDLTLSAKDLKLSNLSEIRASNTGQGDAGNIVLNIANQIDANDSKISTNTENGSGGRVNIAAKNIILGGDSDIQTFVASGAAKGGDITVASDFLIAFDDSDILAFAADGRGGNIDFSQTIFFGESFQISPANINSQTNLDALRNNGRVDINASGGIASGTVLVPDSSFVQNSVTDLPDNVIPPDQLTAGSCIARRTGSDKSSFVVTGNDGLPSRPDESIVSEFPTGTVRSVTSSPKADKTEGLKPDVALTEPTGIFELDDGRMVLSQQCN